MQRGKIVSLTQKDFFIRTGVRFKDEFSGLSRNTAHFHAESNRATIEFIPHSDMKVKTFQKKPPLLFFAEERGMGLGLQAVKTL